MQAKTVEIIFVKQGLLKNMPHWRQESCEFYLNLIMVIVSIKRAYADDVDVHVQFSSNANLNRNLWNKKVYCQKYLHQSVAYYSNCCALVIVMLSCSWMRHHSNALMITAKAIRLRTQIRNIFMTVWTFCTKIPFSYTIQASRHVKPTGLMVIFTEIAS